MVDRRQAVWGLLLAALLTGACGGSSSSTTSPSTTTTTTTTLPSMSVMLSEKAVGNAAAPVTVIAYSSLSCSHCGDFHISTYPLLKTNYIDSGRMRFIFRDYPLNEAALAGSMVARCSGDRFFTTLDALFGGQNAWAYASDYKSALKSVAGKLGITSDDVDTCLASTELRNGVLAVKSTGASTYGVNATPTFIINGQKVIGALTYAEFAAIVDGL
jgi:protein-disulfide isomerase